MKPVDRCAQVDVRPWRRGPAATLRASPGPTAPMPGGGSGLARAEHDRRHWPVVGRATLPAIEAEFGVDRGDASLPYTATMVGFALGGVLMGRLADRFGIMVPVIIGAGMLGLGYLAPRARPGLAVHAGAGTADRAARQLDDLRTPGRRRLAVVPPAPARHRGRGGRERQLSGRDDLAALVAIRVRHVGLAPGAHAIGLFCVLTMLPLALALRRRAPLEEPGSAAPDARSGMASRPPRSRRCWWSPGSACCIAMSMPQVHIVAYCADLGYGPARGAEMLSLMLGFGVVSRLGSGLIADRIGGAGTLVLGSMLQCLALLFYLPFDGLASLYVVSALFGLSQGGIVPSYALIVRDHFPAREAGARVSLVLMATVFGMALGGWMSGAIFDLTGSYRAAFLNGIAWNLVNLSIASWLLLSGPRRRPRPRDQGGRREIRSVLTACRSREDRYAPLTCPLSDPLWTDTGFAAAQEVPAHIGQTVSGTSAGGLVVSLSETAMLIRSFRLSVLKICSD